MDATYHERLKALLLGRTLRADALPAPHKGRPMYALWGEDAGIPAGDVHHHRAYRVYIDYDEARVVTAVDVVVEGELISPCSGYYPEALDEFDFGPVSAWCLQKLEPIA